MAADFPTDLRETSLLDRWLPWRILKRGEDMRRGRGGPHGSPNDTTGAPVDPALEAARRKPRVGLALSSGGARGLAHIGVIQVLEENGIEIHTVAGTSMGAYVGAMWCAGLRGDDLEKLASEMQTSRDLWSLVDPVLPPRRGFVRGRRIEKRLRRTLGELAFEDLERPLSVVATELEGFRRVVFETGDVASAVRASLSIPGVLEPAWRDGAEYIDGGVCDPLPVDVLLDKPLDRIIAVSVIPALADLPEIALEPAETSEAVRPHGMRRGLHWLNRRCNYFAKGNLFDILRSAAFGSQLRLAEASASRADILIRPVSHEGRWHDYTAWRDYIAVGRSAAEEALPAIRSLVTTQIESTRSDSHHQPPADLCA